MDKAEKPIEFKAIERIAQLHGSNRLMAKEAHTITAALMPKLAAVLQKVPEVGAALLNGLKPIVGAAALASAPQTAPAARPEMAATAETPNAPSLGAGKNTTTVRRAAAPAHTLGLQAGPKPPTTEDEAK